MGDGAAVEGGSTAGRVDGLGSVTCAERNFRPAVEGGAACVPSPRCSRDGGRVSGAGGIEGLVAPAFSGAAGGVLAVTREAACFSPRRPRGVGDFSRRAPLSATGDVRSSSTRSSVRAIDAPSRLMSSIRGLACTSAIPAAVMRAHCP